MNGISSHHICPSLCYKLWNTKHLFFCWRPLGLPENSLFLNQCPQVRTLRIPKAEGYHQHQGEIIYLLLKKTLGLAERPFRCPVSPGVLPSDLPSSFNSALGLPYLEAVLIFSAPSLPFIPPPKPHAFFSQGIFGRIDRNYSKNRIFVGQAVACHLVPSWFTGGFELPCLATQDVTANRTLLIQLNKTEKFGMMGWRSPFCTVLPWRQAPYSVKSWKSWWALALMEWNMGPAQPKVALLCFTFD